MKPETKYIFKRIGEYALGILAIPLFIFVIVGMMVGATAISFEKAREEDSGGGNFTDGAKDLLVAGKSIGKTF